MSDYQRTIDFSETSARPACNWSPMRSAPPQPSTPRSAPAPTNASGNAHPPAARLRGEAVHLASRPQPARSRGRAGLPDRQTWAELCQPRRIARPPPLQIDRARNCSMRMGRISRSRILYAIHRRLALSHGGCSSVWTHAASSPGRPFAGVDRDIRVFEQAPLQGAAPGLCHGGARSR